MIFFLLSDQNFLCSNLCLWHPVQLPHTFKSLALSSLRPPIKELWTEIRSSHSFLFSRLNKPSSLSFSSEILCSSQSSEQLGSSPLDWFQNVNDFFALASPKLDTALQTRPHKWRMYSNKGKVWQQDLKQKVS